MWSGIQRRINRVWFNQRCAGIYRTPAVACDPGSKLVVVSQLHHPDMTMYLLAAKSFARFVRPSRFVLVDDGLTGDDRAHLEHHLGRVEFVPRASVHEGSLPQGGTWERLITLARQNSQAFVVQLDADTLTLNEPTEVLDCVRAGRSFTLGTGSGRAFVDLAQASAFAKSRPSNHVQSLAEQALGELAPDPPQRYVRGCSGFTGFAPGHLSMDRINAFSAAMEQRLGRAKWSEWGSEQVTSNFQAANAPDAMVLPVDSYPFWTPRTDIAHATLVHFFGTFRFTGGMYAHQGARLCRQLLV